MPLDKSVFNKNNKFEFGKINKSNKIYKFNKESENKIKSENELLKSEIDLLKTKLKRLEKRNIKEVIKYNNNSIKANTDNTRTARKLLHDAIEWELQFNNLITIIKSIKRLSNSDTIKDLCNNIEYISLPKTRIPVTDNFDVNDVINDVINDEAEYDYVNSEPFIDELEVYEGGGGGGDGNEYSEDSEDGEDGDVEDGDVEDGDVEDGDVEDGDVEDGDVEDGDVEDSDVEDGGESYREYERLVYCILEDRLERIAVEHRDVREFCDLRDMIIEGRLERIAVEHRDVRDISSYFHSYWVTVWTYLGHIRHPTRQINGMIIFTK